jgi:S1-C subfamily serine protease
VQITATTMPGNSGGPVVDFAGNVIGISAFVVNWHGQEFEFCISAAEIEKIVADLDGKIRPLWDIDIDALKEQLDRNPLELPEHHAAN